MMAAGAAPDPFIIKEPSDQTIAPGNRNIDGLTQVDPRTVSGAGKAIIVVGGQSLSANYSQTTYTPSSANVRVLNSYNGGIYRVNGSALPGCGNTLDNYFKRVADKLISGAKYTDVLLVPIAIGSMSFTDYAAGGQMNHRISVAGQRLASLGLTATYICWGQGESDNAAATSQAICTSGLNSIISSCASAFGSSIPMYIASESYYLGATAANVTNAQAAVVGGVVHAGPNLDSLNSSNRYDNIHFNATGADAAATLWANLLP
jgi:hypothetical protein